MRCKTKSKAIAILMAALMVFAMAPMGVSADVYDDPLTGNVLNIDFQNSGRILMDCGDHDRNPVDGFFRLAEEAGLVSGEEVESGVTLYDLDLNGSNDIRVESTWNDEISRWDVFFFCLSTCSIAGEFSLSLPDNIVDIYRNDPNVLFYTQLNLSAPYMIRTLKVGGVNVTDENKDKITGDNISGTVKYDPVTGTLTMKNATILVPDEDNAAAIYYKGYMDRDFALNIQLEGENHIYCNTEQTNANGIMSEKGSSSKWENVYLTIKGPGTLTMERTAAPAPGNYHNWKGIWSEGDILVQDVNLIMRPYSNRTSFNGIFTKNSNDHYTVTIKDSVLDFREENTENSTGGSGNAIWSPYIDIDHSDLDFRLGPSGSSRGFMFSTELKIQNSSKVRLDIGVGSTTGGHHPFYSSSNQVFIDDTSLVEAKAGSKLFPVYNNVPNSYQPTEWRQQYTWVSEDPSGEGAVAWTGSVDPYKYMLMALPVDGENFELIDDILEYTGEPQKPGLREVGGKALTEGTDYEVELSDPESSAVGQYTATFTMKGWYIGTFEKTYSITPFNIKDADVVLSKKSYTFNGKEQKPAINTIKGVTLAEGTDYDAKWPESSKNAGTYTVTITGKGNYTGTTKAEYNIKKATNTLNVKGRTAKVKYKKLKKKAQTLPASKVLKIKNKGQGTLSYKLVSAKKGSKSFKKYFKIAAKNGKVTVKKGLKKGKYKVTVKVKASGNENYEPATRTVTLKIRVK